LAKVEKKMTCEKCKTITIVFSRDEVEYFTCEKCKVGKIIFIIKSELKQLNKEARLISSLML